MVQWITVLVKCNQGLEINTHEKCLHMHTHVHTCACHMGTCTYSTDRQTDTQLLLPVSCAADVSANKEFSDLAYSFPFSVETLRSSLGKSVLLPTTHKATNEDKHVKTTHNVTEVISTHLYQFQ